MYSKMCLSQIVNNTFGIKTTAHVYIPFNTHTPQLSTEDVNSPSCNRTQTQSVHTPVHASKRGQGGQNWTMRQHLFPPQSPLVGQQRGTRAIFHMFTVLSLYVWPVALDSRHGSSSELSPCMSLSMLSSATSLPVQYHVDFVGTLLSYYSDNGSMLLHWLA